jgi:hypothetical protein
MSIDPAELQKLLEERDKSRASRRRAWENLAELRWVLKQICEIELPPPAKKTIDLEGRVVKDGVRLLISSRKGSTGPPNELWVRRVIWWRLGAS